MNSIELAKIVIKASSEREKELSITKLHKFMYIIYGAYLIKKGIPILHDKEDKPRCYQYGPIFKPVQKLYKSNFLSFDGKSIDISNNDEMLSSIIDDTLSIFGDFDAYSLSNWTHREGSAWEKQKKISKYWGDIISDSFIKEEFKYIVKK